MSVTPASDALVAEVREALEAVEVAAAIEIIESSRRTHVQWAEWQERTPGWREQVTPEDPGDPHHHRACIVDYDRVLAVLRATASLLARLDEAEADRDRWKARAEEAERG